MSARPQLYYEETLPASWKIQDVADGKLHHSCHGPLIIHHSLAMTTEFRYHTGLPSQCTCAHASYDQSMQPNCQWLACHDVLEHLPLHGPDRRRIWQAAVVVSKCWVEVSMLDQPL